MNGTIRYLNPSDLPRRIEHCFVLLGVGVQYNFRDNQQLYGEWSQAYRPVIFSDIIPPTPLDRANTNLKDASGYKLELGVRSRSQGVLSYDLSLFALQYGNRIGSVVLNENGTNYVLKTMSAAASPKVRKCSSRCVRFCCW